MNLRARPAPSATRTPISFERWPTLTPEALAPLGRLRAEADAAARAAVAGEWPPIVCADTDGKALTAARQNAAAASVDDGIVFEQADVATLERRWPRGTVATNPPYGERLRPADLEALYRAMGRAFERLAGWRVIVLSGNPAIERAIRRKPGVSHRLWNGPLEARLLRYDL